MFEINPYQANIGNLEKTSTYQSGGYYAPTTIRQMTENAIQAGNLGGDFLTSTGYQIDQVYAPTTLRQMTENSIQGGNISGGQDLQASTGYQTTNYYAPTTLRQMVEHSIQAGNISGGQDVQASTGYQIDQVYAPTTLKQMVENADRAGQLDYTAKANTGYMSTGFYARPTAKQNIANTYRIGAAGTGDRANKPMVYDTAYNMNIDDKKEVLAMTGRAPTTSSYNRIPDNSFTGVRLKELDNAVRDPNRDDVFNPIQRVMPGCTTQNGISTPQESVRLDTCLFEPLHNNPYYVPIVDYYQPPNYPITNIPGTTAYTYEGYNNTPSNNDVSAFPTYRVPLTAAW